MILLTIPSFTREKAPLDTLFDMEHICLSDENLSDFGDREYILYRLNSELNTQFNTRRQILPKTLYAYISVDNKLLEDENGIGLYGTTAFHAVWERVCADTFNNMIDKEPYKMGYTVNKDNEEKSLKKLIEAPIWELTGLINPSKDTLTPDIISIYDTGIEKQFIILDAKYYDIDNGGNYSLPGVGDVTKQYLYHLAYKDFLSDNGIKTVINCFLMPTYQNRIVKKGSVRMDMFVQFGLKDILVLQIPAEEIYNKYLQGICYDIGQLGNILGT